MPRGRFMSARATTLQTKNVTAHSAPVISRPLPTSAPAPALWLWNEIRDALPGILAFLIALIGTVVVGAFNMRARETGLIVSVVLGGGFVAGLLQPLAAWRWAALLVTGLPISYVYAEAIQLSLDIARWGLGSAFLVFVGPFCAAYLSVLLRMGVDNWLLPRVRSLEEP